MKNGLVVIIIFVLLTLTGCISNQYNEYMAKGKAELKKENYEGAISFFEKALKEKSNEEVNLLLDETKEKFEVQSLFEKGTNALKEKKLDEAIEIFSKIIDENQSQPSLKNIIAVAKTSLQEAKMLKEKELLELANSSITQKDYDEAIITLSKLLAINESNEEAKKLLGYTRSMSNGIEALNSEQYDEAIEVFNQIIQKNESNPDLEHIVANANDNLKKATELKEKSLLNVANSVLKDKEYANAIKYFQELLEITRVA